MKLAFTAVLSIFALASALQTRTQVSLQESYGLLNNSPTPGTLKTTLPQFTQEEWLADFQENPTSSQQGQIQEQSPPSTILSSIEATTSEKLVQDDTSTTSESGATDNIKESSATDQTVSSDAAALSQPAESSTESQLNTAQSTEATITDSNSTIQSSDPTPADSAATTVQPTESSNSEQTTATVTATEPQVNNQTPLTLEAVTAAISGEQATNPVSDQPVVTQPAVTMTTDTSSNNTVNTTVQKSVPSPPTATSPPPPILCESTDNEFVLSVCDLCKAKQAYLLTKDNWFVIGLTNNYKTELSKILTHVETVFPNARWLASFSDEHICIVSSTEMPAIDVDHAVFFFTNQHITDFVKSNILPLANPTVVYRTGFKYVPLGDNSYLDEFIIQYQIASPPSAGSGVSLNFTKALLKTSEKSVIYSGTITINDKFSLPFDLDAAKSTDYYYANSHVAKLGFTISDVLSKVLISDPDKAKIFHKIDFINGPSNLDKYQAAALTFRLLGASNKLDQLTIQSALSPDFAITPEFLMTKNQYSVIVNMTDPQDMPSLLIEGQATNPKLSESLNARIDKNENEQNILLTQNKESSLLQISSLENVFQGHSSILDGLFPHYENFDSLKKLYLVETNINVKSNPIPSYLINSKIVLGETDSIGEFEALISFIGGMIHSKTKVSLPKEDLFTIIPKGAPALFFEQYASPQELEITHNNHDLDTQQYSIAFEGLANGDRYWTRGTTLNYKFLLDKCLDATNAFCKVMTNMMDCKVTPLTLRGNIDNEEKITLITEALPGKITLPSISFTDIHLNLDLSLKNITDSELYITSQNTFQVSSDQGLNLDGKIIFDETHGILASKSPETWTNAINLDFLHISGPQVTGVINPESCDITEVAANGVMLWGRSCYSISPDNVQDVTFLKERCFYGKGEIRLDLNNLQKSYVSGIYSGITPVMILSSILGYEDAFIVDKVAKQFLDNRFLDYVQIMYVPKKESAVQTSVEAKTAESPVYDGDIEENDETTLLEVSGGYPAGLSIKGNSELMGLTGLTTIHVDVDTKETFAMFHFEVFEIAHGNIILKADSLENSNNLMFKISKGYEDAINNQGLMQTKVTVMGLPGDANFTFLKDNIQFKGLVNSEVFKNIEILGDSRDIDNFVDAVFTIQGTVQDDLTNVDKLIQDFGSEWAEKITNLISAAEQDLLDVKRLGEEKAQVQCQSSSCPLIYECRKDPVYTCTKHQKKEVCKNAESYCLNAILECKNNKHVCINEVEICTKNDPARPSVCLASIKECKGYDYICQEWGYKCLGESLTTCEDFDLIDDPTECLEFGWVCDEVQVPDPECQTSCELRSREYDDLNGLYFTLKTNYEVLKNNNNKLMNFISSTKAADENNQGFQFLSFKFNTIFDTQKQTNELLWKAEYNLNGQKRTVDLVDLDIMDKTKFINNLFDSIGQQLANENGFKWKKPQQLQNDIETQLSSSKQSKSLSLHLF